MVYEPTQVSLLSNKYLDTLMKNYLKSEEKQFLNAFDRSTLNKSELHSIEYFERTHKILNINGSLAACGLDYQIKDFNPLLGNDDVLSNWSSTKQKWMFEVRLNKKTI